MLWRSTRSNVVWFLSKYLLLSEGKKFIQLKHPIAVNAIRPVRKTRRQKHGPVWQNEEKNSSQTDRAILQGFSHWSSESLMPSARAVIKPHTRSIPQESNPTEAAAAANPLKVSSEERKTIRLSHEMKHSFRERSLQISPKYISLIIYSPHDDFCSVKQCRFHPYNEGLQ